jgi:hypothetical protein
MISMWWRILMAVFAGLIALVTLALTTGVVGVAGRLSEGASPPPPSPLILGEPPIFYMAVGLIVLLALPLLLRLIGRRRGERAP